MPKSFFPPQNVIIRTPMLEARLPTDDEYHELVAQIDDSIYAGMAVFPFFSDWIGKPAESMQYMWRSKADWKPDLWHFPLCIFVDDRIVGCQGIEAKEFATLRSVSTGSWLLADVQGQGIGKEMRTAVLHFAFAGLGALEAHSEARVENHASVGVTRALGYEFTHTQAGLFRGERGEQWKMILRRDDWEQHPLHQRNDIEIDGLDEAIDWFIAPASDAD